MFQIRRGYGRQTGSSLAYMRDCNSLIWGGKTSACPPGKAAFMSAHLLAPLLAIIQQFLEEETVYLKSREIVMKKDLRCKCPAAEAIKYNQVCCKEIFVQNVNVNISKGTKYYKGIACFHGLKINASL